MRVSCLIPILGDCDRNTGPAVTSSGALRERQTYRYVSCIREHGACRPPSLDGTEEAATLNT